MPSDFPGSPRLLKGALVVFEALVPVPTNIIAFQYNPDQVTRQFQQRGGSGAAKATPDPCRNAGDTAPRAAADGDASACRWSWTPPTSWRRSNPLAVAAGLHPTLAALELLLYPPSTQLILDEGAREARLGARLAGRQSRSSCSSGVRCA